MEPTRKSMPGPAHPCKGVALSHSANAQRTKAYITRRLYLRQAIKENSVVNDQKENPRRSLFRGCPKSYVNLLRL